jgi:hypothetical protein
MPSYDRALWALPRLDSWAGIGHVTVGMARQGYDLQLTRTTRRAGVRPSTRPGEHSPTSATGTRWERTPWYATQRAAWGALQKRFVRGYQCWPDTVDPREPQGK